MTSDFWATLYVFVLASFIGMGVIRRVSRLLHTPLMSLTNAISAIAVVGAILITGGDYPLRIRVLGAIAGCLVVEGYVKRNNPIRVLRDSVVIYEGALGIEQCRVLRLPHGQP